MKIAWLILSITALTDFIITGGTALATAMMAGDNAHLPSYAVLFVCLLGGLVSAARTIQNTIRQTSENTANLIGSKITTNGIR